MGGAMVFPLSFFVVACLLAVSTSLRSDTSLRPTGKDKRASPSSDLTHFTLSGFSLTDSNHVDTAFSVQGLDDLPPLNQGQPQPANKPTVSSIPHKTTFPHPSTFPIKTSAYPIQPFLQKAFPNIHSSQPNLGEIFSRPSGRFPTLFNPFRNFFNFPSFNPDRQFPTAPIPPSPFTTPSTIPSTKATLETSTTLSFSPRILNEDSDYVYHDSDYDYLHTNNVEDIAYDENHINTVENLPHDNPDQSPTCPGSLRECLTACSPVISISKVAYKLCVNECLDRCT